MADAKRTPPEITADDIALLLIAVLAERGIGDSAARADTYARMTGEGYRLHEAVTAIVQGQVQAGDVIVREGGVGATMNGQHIVFGHPAEDGFARFATGPTLTAIAAEWQGAPPHQADAAAAITRIRGY